MSESVKNVVEKLVRPIIENMGYEYVDTEYAKQGKDWLLTLYADKPGGILIDDCEQISRACESVLDEKDPIPGSYTLVVSSPGLDRPLKTDRDFERHMGSEIDVKLYKPFMDKKEFTGTLVDAGDGSFTIASGDDEITFEKNEVAKVSLHVSF